MPLLVSARPSTPRKMLILSESVAQSPSSSESSLRAREDEGPASAEGVVTAAAPLEISRDAPRRPAAYADGHGPAHALDATQTTRPLRDVPCAVCRACTLPSMAKMMPSLDLHSLSVFFLVLGCKSDALHRRRDGREEYPRDRDLLAFGRLVAVQLIRLLCPNRCARSSGCGLGISSINLY
ncbi:hypothetical protein C8R44DRAFT_893354 [Mycena epipterygia]|nr:hypothetical protein C8R44DRAFT_893354 [Mycena epipterygia]